MSRRVGAPSVPVSRTEAANGGGHRALTFDQLLKRYAHLVGLITGIAADIEPAPGAAEFATAYVSGCHLAVRDRGAAGLRTQSGGKGLACAKARAGALCEAVERCCGARHGDEPVMVGFLRALGDQAVYPDVCQLYADRQFRERDRWNRSGSPLPHVPEPFDENRPRPARQYAAFTRPVWSG